MRETDQEGKIIDSILLNDNIDADIRAGNHFVSLDLGGATVRTVYLFTPNEAEQIAHAILEAAEHIRSLTPSSE